MKLDHNTGWIEQTLKFVTVTKEDKSMANLTRWNPRNELEISDPFRPLERMMDELWRTWTGPQTDSGRSLLRPAMDVSETDHHINVRLDLPGMKPEDVRVEVENQTLTISGQTSDSVEKDGERYHYRERTYGSFQRSVRLPNTIDVEHIDANFENGVLSISLPKLPQAQPKQISIKAGQSNKK
jgi:HSP20 family protein